MRFLPALLAVLLCFPVEAETIRVAVARGQKLVVEGKALVVRATPDEEPEALESPATFEHVGPFISHGDALDSRWLVSDAEGELKVNGLLLGGSAELVLDKGTIVAIDSVDLETYVASVVGAEVPSSWPAEALEAQAIAARTYVLQRREVLKGRAPYDVEATVAAQVYRGRDSHSVPSVLAADTTRGQVLRFEGVLAEAYFFSRCAGTTESAKDAFGKSVPYLVPVSCESGEDVPALNWKKTFPVEQMAKALGGSTEVRNVIVTKTTESGRVAAVRVETADGKRAFTGADFRRMLGYQALPSLAFRVRTVDGAIEIEGRGAGHGVGLCQWCAFSMAKRGKSAPEILQHFYPGTTIEPLERDVVAAKEP